MALNVYKKVAELKLMATKNGINIVLRAMEEPVRTIAANAGLEGSVVVERLRTKKWASASTRYKQWVNMIEAGIVDPAKVTRTALQNPLLSQQ